jgi:hypothetical protein
VNAFLKTESSRGLRQTLILLLTSITDHRDMQFYNGAIPSAEITGDGEQASAKAKAVAIIRNSQQG